MALTRPRAAVVALLLLLAAGRLVAQPAPVPSAQAASLTSTTPFSPTVRGFGTIGLQITGTWVGTLQFFGSVDGADFSNAINCTPPSSTTAVTSTTANGLWSCPVSGLAQVRVVFNPYTSGTAVVTVQAATSGGGGSGGGGGAASSVTINDPSVTTQKAAVNASGQLSITCANCSGSGASAVDNSAFTAGTTSGAPAMGFFHATIDTVTDGRTATLAMDSKRSLFTVIRDAATNARGVNVTAGNALTVDGSAVTQPGSVADGADVTQGAKADNKSTATDTTAISAISILKEISFMEQNPASRAVTNAGTFAVQAAQSGTWTVQPGNTANTTPWLMTGSGTAGTAATGVLTVQGIASMTKLLVTPDSVALPANQSVNVAQINGVTPLMGTGNTGTGSPRVTIATDQAAVAGLGIGATGAAPPANASYLGGLGSGATGGFTQPVTSCDTQAFLDMTTATTTELVALTASRKVYVCYWLALANGTTVMTFKRGTGTNCGTGTTSISPAWDLVTSVGFSGGGGLGAIFDNQTAGNALCVTSSAAVNLHIYVRYAVY